MTHEKKKMTRAEAIASLQKYVPVNDPAAIIDFYIEAGMLEIVEEKEQPRRPTICGISFAEVEGVLKHYGYKIIKS